MGIVLTATDADNNPLTYSIVTGPANGSLIGAAPTVTYTPNPGYYGPDSFTFRANDGSADSNVATVSISVTPVRADVTITILDAPDPVVVGQPLTYTIPVSTSDQLWPRQRPSSSLSGGVVLSAAPPVHRRGHAHLSAGDTGGGRGAGVDGADRAAARRTDLGGGHRDAPRPTPRPATTAQRRPRRSIGRPPASR